MPRIYEYATVRSIKEILYCTDPDLVDDIFNQILTGDPKTRRLVEKRNDYELYEIVSGSGFYHLFLNALLDAGYEPFALYGSMEIHLRKIV